MQSLSRFGVELERVNCILCGFQDEELLLTGVDRLLGREGSFSLVKCSKCGLVYLNPRPTKEMFQYYYPEGDYYSFVPRSKNKERETASLGKSLKELILHFNRGYPLRSNLPISFRFLARAIVTHGLYPYKDRFLRFPRYIENGRLLDIGCGAGKFLDEIKPYGFETYGVDLDERATAYAREQGHNVFCKPIEDANFDDNFFDVVRASHVVEHMPNPEQALLEAYRVLKPGGLFLVLLPNIDSFLAKKYRSYWFQLDIPRHLYHFTPESISKLLTKAGFNEIKITTHNSVSHIVLSRQYLKNEKVGRFRQPYNFKLWYLVLVPYAWLTGKLWGGDMMVVEAIK